MSFAQPLVMEGVSLDKHPDSCLDKQIRGLVQKMSCPVVSNNTRRVISAVQK